MTLHLHIALAKMSNCCAEKKTDLFHWILDFQTVSPSTRLTIRYDRPFSNLFTI